MVSYRVAIDATDELDVAKGLIVEAAETVGAEPGVRAIIASDTVASFGDVFALVAAANAAGSRNIAFLGATSEPSEAFQD